MDYTREVAVELFGPSSGTDTTSLNLFAEAAAIIVLETMQMSIQDFSLAGARQRRTLRQQLRLPRPEVIESLERSLAENQAVWSELARH